MPGLPFDLDFVIAPHKPRRAIMGGAKRSRQIEPASRPAEAPQPSGPDAEPAEAYPCQALSSIDGPRCIVGRGQRMTES